jgi:hypothetical protein
MMSVLLPKADSELKSMFSIFSVDMMALYLLTHCFVDKQHRLCGGGDTDEGSRASIWHSEWRRHGTEVSVKEGQYAYTGKELRKARDKTSLLFVVLGAATPRTAPATHLRVANPEGLSQPEQGCILHAPNAAPFTHYVPIFRRSSVTAYHHLFRAIPSKDLGSLEVLAFTSRGLNSRAYG